MSRAARVATDSGTPPLMTSSGLKPFWRYYGGKWRAAPRYPEPLLNTIVEPFAGAAGYSLRYPERRVILVEKYHVVAEIWRFLIGAREREILDIPIVLSTNDLPDTITQGARWLVGFHMNAAAVQPCRTTSAGILKLRTTTDPNGGWTEATRARVARQVSRIRHWQIIEGDYTGAPDILATWFVDPPYNNKAGSYYVESDLDYAALASWCVARSGQRIVCENEGATWLPFRPFATLKAGVNGHGSKEVIWP
jgi:hypothetical protein